MNVLTRLLLLGGGIKSFVGGICRLWCLFTVGHYFIKIVEGLFG